MGKHHPIVATPPAAQPQVAQVEQGEPAAAKAIILTHHLLGRSSPKKAPQHKAIAPNQGVQEWGLVVGHLSLKAPPKEWVLANRDHPQLPNMGCLGLEVVAVELEVVIK